MLFYFNLFQILLSFILFYYILIRFNSF